MAFPLLFLTAAAVAAYVLLARLVLAERSIIGTLWRQAPAGAGCCGTTSCRGC